MSIDTTEHYNPLVSIILPTYNSANTILDTLFAIKNQTYQNIEVIVVDAFSKDNTLNLIKKIIPSAIIYNLKPAGDNAARNFAIRKSKGEYLFMLNSDDFITSSSIEYLISHITKNGKDVIFLPVFSRGGLRSKIRFKRRFLSTERVFFAHSASLMIKRETHIKYGFYTERMPSFSGDVEFLYKLLKGQVSMIVAPYSQSAYGVYTYGGKSAKGSYLIKLRDEFNFRKKYIFKDINDSIYCLVIVPMSYIYYHLKMSIKKLFRV